MTYGAQTWILTKQALDKPAIETDQNRKKYARHHIQGQNDQQLGQGEDKGHRYNQQCEENEVDLCRVNSNTTDGPHVSPLGDHIARKDDKGDQPSSGETTWINTGATRSGRGQPMTG